MTGREILHLGVTLGVSLAIQAGVYLYCLDVLVG